MDVGRQEGHQLHTELDLTRKWIARYEKNAEIVDRRSILVVRKRVSLVHP